VKLEPNLSNSTQSQMRFDFDAPTEALERTELEREEAHFFIARMREILERAGEKPHDMRTPCQFCDCPLGVLVVQGGQNTVRCAQCRRHSYNAPKTETGQIARTVRTLRTDMKPSQQARILDRDHGRCILCGGSDDLTIGHLLSIADGARLNATESELNDDANLAAMCEGCNAGLGARSISTRTYLIIMLHILQAEIRRNGPQR
jgi:5-methylcytosine-specific restriction endonuclease McrA